MLAIRLSRALTSQQNRNRSASNCDRYFSKCLAIERHDDKILAHANLQAHIRRWRDIPLMWRCLSVRHRSQLDKDAISFVHPERVLDTQLCTEWKIEFVPS